MKRTVHLFASLSLALLAGVLSLAAQEVQPLEKGKPIENDLKGGDVHAYSVRVEVGEFLDATVEQRGIDVVVRVFAPGGAMVAEVDSPNGTSGPEPIGLAVKVAGIYRIEVASVEKGAAPGRYEIRLNQVLTPAQYADRLAKEKAQSDAVVKWFAANAVPIKTVEAR